MKNFDKIYTQRVLDGTVQRYRNQVEALYRNLFIEAGGLLVDKSSLLQTQLEVAAVQRLRQYLLSSSNLKAFLLGQNGFFSVFSLPYGLAEKISKNRIVAIMSHCFFVMHILPLSVGRVVRALVRIVQSSEIPNPQKLEKVYVFSLPKLALMSGPATAFTFEKWCREKHFLDPILLAYDRTYDDRPDNNFRNGGMCFFGKIKLLYKIYLVNIVLLNLLTCLLLLLIGKWRPIFMLDDKIYSRVFYYLDVKQLYEQYLFLYQGDQYRPAWTWVAEQRGSAIVQVNYSSLTLPTIDGNVVDRCGLSTALWSSIVPLNPGLKEFFETAVNCGKVKTINVIKRPSVMFTDSDNVNMPIFKKSAFAIFDVPPLSYRAYVGSNGTAEYVLIDGKDPTYTNRRFVLDCLKVADRYEFQLVTKLKREDPRLDKKYIELLKALESQGRLTILSPEISPARVLQHSRLSACMPFTSVGYYSEFSENICFYDPIEKLAITHSFATGIPLISGFNSLDAWARDATQIRN